ncbi:helix-turn-helix domain-containing protein [Thiorhodococcus drewsii]|uniref:helix-turn-helix domain-containing protein n=1 Tax=Thiorhodococcus drewsii TaxID=210408 RepID=UPI00030A597C|nr:AraC family transcriptional regulator [Thiorhodococcus drewsii]
MHTQAHPPEEVSDSTPTLGARRDSAAALAASAFVDGQGNRINRLLEGRCTQSQVDLKLEIHANDTLETASAHGSLRLPPRVTVCVMLEGDLDAALDGRPLAMTAQHGPSGHLWINRREALLERWVRAGQRVRKVVITLPVSQPGDGAGESSTERSLIEGFPEDLTFLRWQPSAQAIRYAEEILAEERGDRPIASLESTIAALAIFRGALSHGVDEKPARARSSPGTRDLVRARKARDYILRSINEPMSIADIASRNGMSVSTLQRVFKGCFGTTVNEFMRMRRLELARLALLERGVTVGEAAFEAGYSSAANFSTAFQRAFRYPPSACLRG